MTDDEIRILADQIIGPILGPHGFDHASVRSSYDHTDEPAIYVTAHLRPGSDVLEAGPAGTAKITFRHALEARGDDRFPYFRYDYPDDEVILDDEDVVSPAR
jgi:hypothetical protein